MTITGIRHDWPEKPGFTVSRPHGHGDYTFLHFMCHVSLAINGVSYELQPGACLIYSPSASQWYTGENGLYHNWMHISGEYGKLLTEFGLESDTVYYPSNAGFISGLCARMEAEFFSSEPYREAYLEAKLQELTICLSRAVHSALPGEASRQKRESFDRIRKMFLSSPETQWRVADLARLALVSESGFFAAYRQFYGSTPMNDLIEARIRYAQSLLLTETIPVGEIASAVGYTNPYHFSRQFRALTGETPAQYRKERTSQGEKA